MVVINYILRILGINYSTNEVYINYRKKNGMKQKNESKKKKNTNQMKN
jgi:hypothetical protein